MKYFSPSLLDGSVTEVKLAYGAVTRNKIALAAVDNARLATNTIRREKLRTVDAGVSGSIPATSFVDITLAPDCFWPMIHSIQPPDVWVSGHLTDGVGAEYPRLSLNNSGGVARTYDLDYRNVIS